MKRYLLTAVVLMLPSIATAQWQLDGGQISGPECGIEEGKCTPIAAPCAGTSLAATPDSLYVTCEGGGILWVDLTADPPRPVEVRRMLEPVAAKSVKVVDGRVWVETSLGSRPLEAFDRVAPPIQQPPKAETIEPSAAPAPEQAEPPEEPPPPPRTGRVVEVGTGWVIVDVGSDSGLREEGWVEFLRVESVDLGEGQIVQRERRVGLGQVDTLNKQRARVDLGLNERVPVDSIVRPNPEGVTSIKVLMTPRRPRGVWEVELNARPFLALSTLGGGAILDGRIGKRFDFPLAIDLVFAPFAFGVARDGDILTFAGNAIVSYDTTAFQIGLGAGASRFILGGSDFIGGENPEEPSFNLSFSAAQFVRLGSVDGVHLEVLNNFALYADEFVFGGITINGQIPIQLFKDVAWVIVRGGGGVPGHIFGEAGIRILAVGNGGPGSVFLAPTVGGGLLTGETWAPCEDFEFDRPVEPGGEARAGICRQQYSYGGPLVGFGAEWRF